MKIKFRFIFAHIHLSFSLFKTFPQTSHEGAPYVCNYLSCGRYELINYAVIQLLGQNLADIKKRFFPFSPFCPSFSLSFLLLYQDLISHG